MDDRRHRFEVQVLPHLDAAFRFARWLSHSPSDADDVVQEAVLRAFRGFDALRGPDVKAWLLTIVRNCHLTAITQQQRRAFVPLPDEHDALDGQAMIAATPDPENSSIRRDEERTLGGRADYFDHHRAAVVVYQHGSHVINVFSWAATSASVPNNATRNGYHLVFWKTGNLVYCAVSDTALDELLRLVQLLQDLSAHEKVE